MRESESSYERTDVLALRELTSSVQRALLESGSLVCKTGLLSAAALWGVTGVCGANPFPAVFELGSLSPAQGGDGSQGFVVEGVDVADYSGGVVSDAGDLNADGIDDFVIAAVGADPRGHSTAGESYLIFGRIMPFAPSFELKDLYPSQGGNGRTGAVLEGIDADDASGYAVSRAGDVNGDGIEDLIVSAFRADPPGERTEAGEVYIVFGRDTRFPPILSLRSLFPAAGGDGSKGFVLRGIADDDQAGVSASDAGDVNGDGVDDLLIGAYVAGYDSTGQSYVVFGRTDGFPPIFELRRLNPTQGGDGTEGVIIKGTDRRDRSGRSVSGAGDVNGDGLDDVIIGSSNAHGNAGEAYVVFGRAAGFPAVVPLHSLFPAQGGDGTEGFVLQGIDPYDLAAECVSDAGDLNGDGIDDVIIGAYFADPHGLGSAGEAYVVFGRTTGFPPLFELRRLQPDQGGDGSAGFVLMGIHESDQAGRKVSAAGDVNADGIDDVIIGAHNTDVDGQAAVGEAYVVYGRTTGFPAAFELRNLMPAYGGDGSQGFILEGYLERDRTGSSVSRAGDVNADGVDDLVVGSANADAGGKRNAGVTYVVFGRAAGIATPR